ncbi:hypothetical protein CEXT_61911 [Caerostris extrusa]|uniref:Uncharacterized protein n=1 Tax=Caerostris extrusa TaxID=172846 RepID=A0AAV4MVT6_CAEEX|nr:hypothetical protein CEXT_61911 [Caerostris extrusa]
MYCREKMELVALGEGRPLVCSIKGEMNELNMQTEKSSDFLQMAELNKMEFRPTLRKGFISMEYRWDDFRRIWFFPIAKCCSFCRNLSQWDFPPCID